jgi:4-hydroxy-tetrahydrodipicolinate synthase
MGRMEAEIRLPLCPMAEGTKQKLIEVLRQQNLI